MKVVLLITLSFLSGVFNSIAQPSIQWQKSLGGLGDDWANAVQQTKDGGYIVAGYTDSNDGDVTGHHGTSLTYDYWITKLNSLGTIQWQKSLGGTGDDIARSVIQTKDSGYIVAGSSSSNDGDVTGNKGGSDYWIVKLSSAGAIQWQKSFGGSDDDDAYSIQQTFDGGYIVAGSSYSIDSDLVINYGGDDYWIVKLSSSGTIQWKKTIGGSNYDEAYAISQTADSGYIVAGASTSNDINVSGNHGGYDYWIVKLNSAGTLQWQKSLGGSADDYAYSVEQTRDGGYIVAGYSSSTDRDVTGNNGNADYWIVKLSSAGTLQWQKSLGGSRDDESYSIHQTPDSGYIVAGYVSSSDSEVTGNHGYYDYWIVRLNSAGTMLWQKCLGGSGNEFAYAIQITADGGFVVAGWSSSNDGDVSGNHGLEDFWIVKLSPDPTAIEENNNPIAVFNIYPNPATNQLTLYASAFSANEASCIYIMNALGERVFAPVSLKGMREELTINIADLTPGVYFVEAIGEKDKWVGRFVKE